jgi:hypothetical protein
MINRSIVIGFRSIARDSIVWFGAVIIVSEPSFGPEAWLSRFVGSTRPGIGQKNI